METSEIAILGSEMQIVQVRKKVNYLRQSTKYLRWQSMFSLHFKIYSALEVLQDMFDYFFKQNNGWIFKKVKGLEISCLQIM